MKKIILLLCFYSPLFVFSQSDSTKSDTLILDKFFHFVGRQIKKGCEENPKDVVQQNQDTSNNLRHKLKFGFSISYLGTWERGYLDHEYLVPALTLNFKKSTFSLGPKFELYGFGDLNIDNPGILFSYKIDPFKEHRFFDFYIQYTQGFSRNKHSYIEYLRDDTTIIKVPTECTSTYVENIIGYGIKLNIFKGLYFYQSSGIGIEWNKDKYIYGSPKIYSKIATFTNLTSHMMAGVGYRFR
jgi:hypothetical protein